MNQLQEELEKKAISAFINENYAEAVDAYQACLQESPQPRFYWYTGLSYFLLGQEEEAQSIWMVPFLEGQLDSSFDWLSECSTIFDKVIIGQLEKDNILTAKKLRDILLEINGDYYNPLVEESIQKSIDLILKEGISAAIDKRFPEAGDKFITVIGLDENNVNAWYNLAMVYYEINSYINAQRTISRAIELEPDKVSHQYGWGLISEELEDFDRAILAYKRVLELDERHPDGYTRLGLLLTRLERYDEAEEVYRQSIANIEGHYGVYLNLANLLLYHKHKEADIEVSVLEEMSDLYQKALKLSQGNVPILEGLSIVYERLGKPDQALLYQAHANFHKGEKETAIELYSQYLQEYPQKQIRSVYDNLLILYNSQEKYERAIAIAQQRIAVWPESPQLYKQLIYLYQSLGDLTSATEVIQDAEQKFPQNTDIQKVKQWLLPIIYDSTEEIQFYRQRFTQYLQDLIDNSGVYNSASSLSTECLNNLVKALEEQTNFYLQYQGQDDRELQKKYGEFVHRIVSLCYPHLVEELRLKSPSPDRKIKIGYVSASMYRHTVGKLFAGWVKHAKRERFKIYCYHIGESFDAHTQNFNLYSDYFQHLTNKNFVQIAETILSDQLDVVVFPDVGMHPKMTLLSSLRLAPIQCVSWGHPITTGSPTIDYFLSCDSMEPEDGESHYTESLVRLPNISIAYALPRQPEKPQERKDFALSEESVLYLSCQSLYKYLPQYDYVFAKIAVEVPQAKILFLESNHSKKITEQFQKRLKLAFADYELESERFCVFLPRLNHHQYLSVNIFSDIFLDTLSWSGGNTTLEALACCLPVVTCPGRFMRGRHAYAILKTIGIEETIAKTEDEYIDLAIRLGHNSQWRQTLRAKIKDNQDRLFEDRQVVAALECFYEQAIFQKLSETNNQTIIKI